jgi:biotin synthase
MTVENIRVSIGSASVIGLYHKQFDVPPTTCYLMTHKEGHCSANCGFCPQARSSGSASGRLSRIIWPVYPFNEFLSKLKYLPPTKRFKRICIQTLNYPENLKDLIEIITQIKRVSSTPMSVAVPPMSKENFRQLKFNGVDRVGIALDGATPEIFNQIKGEGVEGPYYWDAHYKALKDALEVFSDGSVSTHLIVGLGETEEEITERIEDLSKLNILVSLFAFTPVKGTKFEELKQPDIVHYRTIQLIRFLITNENKVFKDFAFNSKGKLINININRLELRNIIESNEAFLTSGCKGCNRPYYTSRPSGPMYNFPRNLNQNEMDEIYNQLIRFVR